jgi:NAD-dependent deacetylase
VIRFGEMPLRLDPIYQMLADCELFLSIDTSRDAQLEASFVEEAHRAGADTVELNFEPSQSASLFAERIYCPATKIAPDCVARLTGGR